MSKIVMTGVDYGRADVSVRGLFSFTKDQAENCLRAWKYRYPKLSFLLLTTCNRTELWVEGDGVTKLELPVLLCESVGLIPLTYQEYFVVRTGHEAEKYLFRLTCGMESQIFFEDQILTQVKEALGRSRQLGTIQASMDKLFLAAITTAKLMKTRIKLEGNKSSVMDRVLKIIASHGVVANSSCLVIGNGEMGRLAAGKLQSLGFPVTMTVRQYHKGEVRIPKGCQVVPYENRLNQLEESTIIVSATSSPHHTLHFDDVRPRLEKKRERIFFDLAVPRDISVRIGQLEGVHLYDMDLLGEEDISLWDEKQINMACQMMEDGLLEYHQWLQRRSMAPKIDRLSSDTSEDLLGRLQRCVDLLDLKPDERQQLREEISQAAYKSVSSLLFGIVGEREGY